MAGLLGGSWAVISMVISPLIWVITIVTLLITPLITTHEPPSGRGRAVSHYLVRISGVPLLDAAESALTFRVPSNVGMWSQIKGI